MLVWCLWCGAVVWEIDLVYELPVEVRLFKGVLGSAYDFVVFSF